MLGIGNPVCIALQPSPIVQQEWPRDMWMVADSCTWNSDFAVALTGRDSVLRRVPKGSRIAMHVASPTIFCVVPWTEQCSYSPIRRPELWIP